VYLYRAIDQLGQVIDVLISEKRDLAATRRFFTRALQHGPSPIEVTTDHAAAYPRVLDELVPACGCRIGHPRQATWVYSWISPPSRS
jgi:IS6 family transposase